MRAILFIEDDRDTVKFSSFNMAMGGCKTVPTRKCTTMREADCNRAPDRIALDSIMQFIRGINLGENFEFFEEATTIPCAGLPGKENESRQMIGFGVEESDKIISIGDLAINISRHQVSVNGREISLTATEFKILVCLAERLGRVQSRDNIIDAVWNYATDYDHYMSETRTIDTHIKRLRQKLGDAGNLIKTIRCFGYKIEYLEA
jgi:two-component system, OmpR family, phosphate regulon response regulator PhoB